MGGIWIGLLSLSLVGGCLLASWLFFERRQGRSALFLLLAGGLLLRLFFAADAELHPWDERFHALVAKNMIEAPLKPMLYKTPLLPYDYRAWNENHIWVHKQPVPLWAMAGSLYLFGLHEWALRLPSVLLSTLGIWLLFLLGRRLFGFRVGYWAAFLYAINGLLLEITGGRVATDHIDLFFQFFVLAAIVWAERSATRRNGWYDALCGCCLGLAILSKWLPALVVLPVWGLLQWQAGHSWKNWLPRSFSLILTAAIVALPWQWYIHEYFPAEAHWESQYNYKHIRQSLGGQGQPWYYFAERIRINYGELVYVPLLWFLVKCLRRPWPFHRWAIAIWFLLPFLFFSFAQTKMQGYLLFAAPTLFLTTALFMVFLRRYQDRFRTPWLARLLAFALIALPIRYSIERMEPFQAAYVQPAWRSQLQTLLKDEAKPVALFNYPAAIPAMFYHELIAYERCPELEALQQIQASGYLVVIERSSHLPSHKLDLPGALYIDHFE